MSIYRAAPFHRVIEALESTRKAVENNLALLRKRLRVRDLLTLQGGHLVLDVTRCSVDLWALRQHLDTLLSQPEKPTDARAVRVGHEIKALARGEFLQGEPSGTPWIDELRRRVGEQLCEARRRLGG